MEGSLEDAARARLEHRDLVGNVPGSGIVARGGQDSCQETPRCLLDEEANPGAGGQIGEEKKMNGQAVHEQALIEKIRALPPERVLEVEDFVDFLLQRDMDRPLVRAAARLSEDPFRKVWDNTDDADYDRL